MDHGRGGEERPHRRAEGSKSGGGKKGQAHREDTKGEPHSESSKAPGTKKRAVHQEDTRGEREGPKSGGGGAKKAQAHREDAKGEGGGKKGQAHREDTRGEREGRERGEKEGGFKSASMKRLAHHEDARGERERERESSKAAAKGQVHREDTRGESFKLSALSLGRGHEGGVASKGAAHREDTKGEREREGIKAGSMKRQAHHEDTKGEGFRLSALSLGRSHEGGSKGAHRDDTKAGVQRREPKGGGTRGTKSLSFSAEAGTLFEPSAGMQDMRMRTVMRQS